MRAERRSLSLWLRLLLGAAVIIGGFGLGAAAMLFIALAEPAESAPGAGSATGSEPEPGRTRIWIGDALGGVGVLHLETGLVETQGAAPRVLTDLSFAPDGRLYGLTFDRLYQMTPDGGFVDLGPHGVACGNALEIAPDGTAYAMGCGSDGLFALDLRSGASRLLFATGFRSSGDLAAHDGLLLLAAQGSGSDRLVALDPRTGAVEDRGGFAEDQAALQGVYGLVSPGDGWLYAGAGYSYYRVDPASGAATRLGDYVGSGLGPAYGWALEPSGEPLTVRLNPSTPFRRAAL